MKISFPPRDEKKRVRVKLFMVLSFFSCFCLLRPNRSAKTKFIFVTGNCYANIKFIFSSSTNYDKRMIVSKALCDLLFALGLLLNSFTFLATFPRNILWWAGEVWIRLCLHLSKCSLRHRPTTSRRDSRRRKKNAERH